LRTLVTIQDEEAIPLVDLSRWQSFDNKSFGCHRIGLGKHA
jgi:hypothetical protein